MKKTSIINLLAFIIMSLMSVSSFCFAKEIQDIKDLERALVSRPLQLLVFKSNYCKYCLRFESEVGQKYSSTDVAKKLPLLRFCIDEVENLDELMKRFNIRGFPTFILVNQDGQELDRFAGYGGVSVFWKNIDSLIDRNGL